MVPTIFLVSDTTAVWTGAQRYSFKITALTPPGGGEDGGVPEPSAWALMIAGFGMAGGALRRRRAPPAARFIAPGALLGARRLVRRRGGRTPAIIGAPSPSHHPAKPRRSWKRLTPRFVIKQMLPVVLAFVVTTPADAALFTATYTGVVNFGYARTKVYNDPGINLVGLPYEAVYVFDTAKGARTTSSSLDNLFGDGANSPVSSVVKIGTTTFVTVGQYYGQERVENDPSSQSVFSYTEDSSITYDGPNILYFTSKSISEVSDQLKGIFSDPLITQSIDFSVDQVGAVGSGYFFFSDQRSMTDPSDPGSSFPYYIYEYQGTSVIDHVVIKSLGGDPMPPPDSPAPEPATWALALTGFAIAGSALRARRSRRKGY